MNKRILTLLFVSLVTIGTYAQEKKTIELPAWINNLKLSGYGMLQYQGSDKEGAKENAFNLRLLRLSLEGRIQQDWYWKMQLQINGNISSLNASPRIVDAFAEWQKYKFFMVKAGQFKRPFTFENPMHPITQGFMSYSQPVSKLSGFSDRTGEHSCNGRDIGLQIQGDFLPNASGRNLLHYQVGVFNGEKCIHLAPPAQRVPMLMAELFDWVKKTKVHPLIKSCVFHYEFEFIHPFADGNGRMGRMWQTLLLMQWSPIFAWIPVETIVKEHQQDYYAVIAQSDSKANSTPFIAFMLRCLKQALEEMKESNQKGNPKSDQKILMAMRENPLITIKEMQEITGLSESGVKKNIRQLRKEGAVSRVGGAKGGHWEVTPTSQLSPVSRS